MHLLESAVLKRDTTWQLKFIAAYLYTIFKIEKFKGRKININFLEKFLS